MTETLLRTKLYIPPIRPNLVPRSRLTGQLDQALDMGCRLALISAPAGFGKTTLLSEWIASRDLTVAWLSLDTADNDPLRFLTYLIEALRAIIPGIGEGVLDELRAPGIPLESTQSQMESALTILINELSDFPDPFAVVLDDYHMIEALPIHDSISFLLDYQPPQMSLVIATRADPPLSFSRLRGQGQLVELHAAELGFSPDEARVFLNEAMGLGLSVDEVAALEKRTEGWIAGLQLAALSMQGRGDATDFIQAFTGSHRYVLDYLTEEVLSQQPEDIRAFLKQTCILNRLNASLCDAVRSGGTSSSSEGTAAVRSGEKRTGQEDSQAVLEKLEAANLFIVPLDEERRWYRYHQLFADALQSRLRASDPVLFKKLHQRAAAWFEKRGFFEYAVRHAAAGGLLETAAELVETNAISMLGRGEPFTLLNLIELLEALADERPWLSIYKSWALALTGQLDQADRWCQKAESVIAANKVKPGRLMLGHIAAIHFYCTSYRGKTDTAVANAQKALEALPENEGTVRGIVTTAMGYSLRFVGEYTQAEAALEAARRAAREAGNRYLELRALSTLSALAFDQCRLHQSHDLAQEALQLATLPGGQIVPSTGWALVGLGLIHYEWNDLGAAEEHTRMAVDLGPKWGDPFDLVHMFLLMADIKIAVGDLTGAQHAFEKGEEVTRWDGGRGHHAVSPGLIDWVQAARARYWLKQGNLEAAIRWAKDSEIFATDEISLYRTNQYRTRARVYLATEQYEAALELLMRLQEQLEATGRTRSLLQTLVLRSLAHQAMNDAPQALSALKRALTLAQPGGFVRIFVDEGEPMRDLLQLAQRGGVSHSYASELLSAFTKDARPLFTTDQYIVELLSDRELEVLRLIANGLSNQQIADELVIAVSTVKSHINHIYGKLGVKSRTQAVARGRALGLL